MDVVVYDKIGKESDRLEDLLLATFPQKTITDAPIASFADGADGIPIKSLSVAIEPVQDLHGQDAPYPAGGGKNLLDFRTKASGTDNGITYTNNDGVITVNGTASGYSFYQSKTFELPAGTYVVNGRPSGSTAALIVYNANTSSGIANPSADNEATFTLSETTPIYVRIAIGDATETNKVFYPMIRLATETDDTFAPYSNLCPISGHTSANVTRTGKNLAGVSFIGAYNTTTGEKAPSATSTYASTEKIKCEGSTAYACSAGFTITQLLAWYWDENGNFIRFDASGTGQVAFTTPANAKYLAISFRQATDKSDVADFPGTQVEKGSTPSTYEAYRGTTYPITFPSGTGTVYGGNITVNQDGSGELVVTDAEIASYNGETLPSTWISDRDVYAEGTSPTTGAQVVYELATPISIPLTAPQITTLLGTNNIWADTGNIESLTYRANLGDYINNAITTAVANALNV